MSELLKILATLSVASIVFAQALTIAPSLVLAVFKERLWLLLQPIVNYNVGRSGWALAFSPIITCNFDGIDGSKWTVPLGLGAVKTTVFNGRPMQLGVHYHSNAASPEGAPGQTLRFIVSFLYPKGKAYWNAW
jgi:hypothetical protein